MYVFNSWKESLELFKPAVIQQLVPVLVTNTKRAYRTLWDAQFCLFAVALVVIFVDIFECLYMPYQPHFVWRVARFVWWSYWCMSGVLALRASVVPKVSAYFRNYVLHIGMLMLVFLVLFYARYQFFMAGYVYPSLLFVGDFHVKLVFVLPWLVLYAEMLGLMWCALMSFFFFDTKPLPGSLICSAGRAALMLFYNVPFFVLFCLLMTIPYLLYLIPDMLLPVSMPFAPVVQDVVLLAAPVVLAVLMAFYIKRVHEQLSCYFWQHGI